MRFPHFWPRPQPAGGGRSMGGRDRPPAERDRPARDRSLRQTPAAAGGRVRREPPSAADEVEAFLAGRLVDHLSALDVDVPAWAALNRLAHADRSELQAVVNGTAESWGTCPLLTQPPWAASERALVRVLLARAPSAEALAEVQRTTLVPLELGLIDRCRAYGMTAEQVLASAAGALRSCRPDR